MRLPPWRVSGLAIRSFLAGSFLAGSLLAWSFGSACLSRCLAPARGGWRDGYLEKAAPASPGNMGTMRAFRKPCRHRFVYERPSYRARHRQASGRRPRAPATPRRSGCLKPASARWGSRLACHAVTCPRRRHAGWHGARSAEHARCGSRSPGYDISLIRLCSPEALRKCSRSDSPSPSSVTCARIICAAWTPSPRRMASITRSCSGIEECIRPGW